MMVCLFKLTHSFFTPSCLIDLIREPWPHRDALSRLDVHAQKLKLSQEHESSQGSKGWNWLVNDMETQQESGLATKNVKP